MDSKRRVIANSALNLIASATPLALLQLLVLPSLNGVMGSSSYGLVVTLISLFTLFPAVFGNTLNNVRIIEDIRYSQAGVSGDFNVLALILAFSSMLLTGFVGLVYIDQFSIADFVGLCVTACLFFIVNYYSVGFLIHVDYKKVLYCNLIRSVGHVLGLLLFFLIGYWYWIYIIGYGLSAAYILLNTSLAREPFRITRFFKSTSKEEAILLVSSLLGNATSYADRILLYPLLGGFMVSVYYAATLLGKLITLAINPVSAVLLSTLGRVSRIGSKSIRSMLLSTALVGIAAYAACVFLSRPVITLLYPDLVEDAMALIFITCATSVLSALVSMVNTIILRFCNMVWQMVINVVVLVSYLGFSIAFLFQWGLLGFAAGTLCAASISLIMRLAILYAKRAEITGGTLHVAEESEG